MTLGALQAGYPDQRVSLSDVQESVLHLSRAIAYTVHLDVVICDERGRIVGGTGPYESLIGNRQPWGRVLDSILDRARTIVLEDPGHDELCRGCERYGDCPETIEIDHPIMLGDACHGVISLVGFTEEQRAEGLSRAEDFLMFLGRVAELLSSKLAQVRYARQLENLGRRLEAVLHSVDEGVLMVDQERRIVLLNRAAEKIFRLGNDAAMGRRVDEVFEHLPIVEVLHSGIPFARREVRCRVRGRKDEMHLVATAQPLFVPGEGLQGVAGIFRPVPRPVGTIAAERDAGEDPFDGIIGESRCIKELKRQTMMAAGSDSTVLILGESGTGKELLARAIHRASDRCDGPFVAVSCAAIPDSLLESELFGYEEGAFTGARRGGKPGKFELANGGTIFLDEIGDLPLHMQAKLLRVLETRQVERVGGTTSVRLDVRVVAATNKDLEKMVEAGAFREDLFFRLNVIPIATPPLRDHREDIRLLVDYFLSRYRSLARKRVDGVSEEALAALARYDWPGNVRELQNALEYAVNMENSNLVSMESLPPRIRTAAGKGDRDPGVLVRRRADAEHEAIARALSMFGNDLAGKRKAAEALGISLTTLYRKLKHFAAVKMN